MLNKNKIPFGLDVSDISLKLVQFGPRRQVAAYTDAPIPKDAVTADIIKDPKGLIAAIRAAVAKPKFGRVTGPYVVASIPETKSFVRVIQMPKMTEEEAREAVPFEAEQYIPMPVGAVYLDWVILGGGDKGNRGDMGDQGKMTVLITAAPKEYVDDYVAILKEAGLKPLALEVESQATARSLVSDAHARESVLIADIDTVRTSLIIYDKGVLEFTSSLPIAGNAFTEAIAKAQTLDTATAEKMKREVGLGEPINGQATEKRSSPIHRQSTDARKALLPVLNSLVDEIKNTVHFHEEHAASKITRLLLAGGSSKLLHLPSFLQEKLQDTGIKVELGNPWNKVLPRGATPPLSREDSLSYATAIGIALRELE